MNEVDKAMIDYNGGNNIRLAAEFSVLRSSPRAPHGEYFKAIAEGRAIPVESAAGKITWRTELTRVYSDYLPGGLSLDKLTEEEKFTASEMLKQKLVKVRGSFMVDAQVRLAHKLLKDDYVSEGSSGDKRKEAVKRRKDDAIALAKMVIALDSHLREGGRLPERWFAYENIQLSVEAPKAMRALAEVRTAMRGLRGSYYEELGQRVAKVARIAGTLRSSNYPAFERDDERNGRRNEEERD